MTEFLRTPQWRSGQTIADFLDSFFRARGWQIGPTTRTEERDLCLGDRHFRKGHCHYAVEYKSGIQTGYTGNVFLETVSVDSHAVPGWVYTCQADFILYAAVLNHKILVFSPEDLRQRIDTLARQFKTVKTGKGQNATYDTHGVLVPLAYAEQNLARQVIEING